MNILALDDEKDVKVLYEYFFSDEIKANKLTLKVYHDPLELLKQTKASDEETLLLTDMMMPNLSGTEVASKLLSKLPNLKVFVISALEVTLSQEEKNNLKIDRVYSKPLNFSKLKEDVVALL